MANKSDSDTTAGGALLSKKQREWLDEGAPDPNTPAHRQLRIRIRERLLRSFRDFALITEYLPDGDVEKAFQGEEVTREHVNGMTAALAIVYGATRDGLGVRGDAGFEPMLKRAIQSVEYAPEDPIPAYWAVEVLFENDRIIVDKPEVVDVDLDRVASRIETGRIGQLSQTELACYMNYYQFKDDFDPYYPSQLRDGLRETGSEEQEKSESRKKREREALERMNEKIEEHDDEYGGWPNLEEFVTDAEDDTDDADG